MVYREWHEHTFNGVTVYLTNAPDNARYLVSGGASGKQSFAQLSRLTGIPTTTIQSRLKAGRSLAEALTPGYASGYKILVGSQILSGKDLGESLGMHRSTIGKRLKAGWDVFELTGPSRRKHLITAFNKTQTISRWAREKQIPRSTLIYRLANMDAELALSLPIDEVSSKNSKRRKLFQSITRKISE